jgi:S-adenosylmethionine synthetase
VDIHRLEAAVRDLFKLTPAGIISSLDLLKPIYSPTAAHGHFGRVPANGCFNWEKTDKAEALRSLA